MKVEANLSAKHLAASIVPFDIVAVHVACIS